MPRIARIVVPGRAHHVTQRGKVIGRCCITTLQPGAELPNIILPAGDPRNSIESIVLPPTGTKATE